MACATLVLDETKRAFDFSWVLQNRVSICDVHCARTQGHPTVTALMDQGLDDNISVIPDGVVKA